MTETAKETSVLFTIIGGIWVGGSAATASTQMINGRRDVIMTGVLDSTRLSMMHRETILIDDWLPSVITMAVSSLVLLAFFIIVPFALKLNRNYKVLCFICAIVPAVSLVSWVGGGIIEYEMLRSLLDNEIRAAAAHAG